MVMVMMVDLGGGGGGGCTFNRYVTLKAMLVCW